MVWPCACQATILAELIQVCSQIHGRIRGDLVHIGCLDQLLKQESCQGGEVARVGKVLLHKVVRLAEEGLPLCYFENLPQGNIIDKNCDRNEFTFQISSLNQMERRKNLFI